MVVKGNKRIKMAERALSKREQLKAIIKDPKVGYDERLAAVIKLNKSPRDESAVRVRTRCQICGRPRAVYRKFGLCRIHLREAAVRGDVPGLVKASW